MKSALMGKVEAVVVVSLLSACLMVPQKLVQAGNNTPANVIRLTGGGANGAAVTQGAPSPSNPSVNGTFNAAPVVSGGITVNTTNPMVGRCSLNVAASVTFGAKVSSIKIALNGVNVSARPSGTLYQLWQTNNLQITVRQTIKEEGKPAVERDVVASFAYLQVHNDPMSGAQNAFSLSLPADPVSGLGVTNYTIGVVGAF